MIPQKPKTRRYDLAIASDYEYDLDFIKLLEKTAHRRQISTYIIYPNNLEETIQCFKKGELRFRFFYDRASDTSPEFFPLHQLVLQKNIPVLDAWSILKWAADKATMHYVFEEAGIHTPYTIILPPWRIQPAIDFHDHEFERLGTPFVVKPAYTTGGGTGVIKNAFSLQDISDVRRTFPGERCLVQQKIVPKEEDGRRFWFRGIFTCGLIQVAWWNDLTYRYGILIPEEIQYYGLLPVFRMVNRIAQACRLNFFSTEIAVTAAGELKVIDYVNEVCDMRLHSKVFDGVPDSMVEKIAGRIVDYAREKMLTAGYY